MAEPEEDEEDNAAALEQLMAQAGRALQWQELEEQFCVLAELGSGTYGHVVLTEPRDGGSPVVLKLMLKERTERRAFLREYCIARCLSGHAACIHALPLAFENSTHFAFGQELAPAGDLCNLLTPGLQAMKVHEKQLMNFPHKPENLLSPKERRSQNYELKLLKDEPSPGLHARYIGEVDM